MAEAFILEFAGLTTPTDTWVVTEVWESRADQGAFMESRLGTALGEAGVTAVPAVRWVPLVAYHVSET